MYGIFVKSALKYYSVIVITLATMPRRPRDSSRVLPSEGRNVLTAYWLAFQVGRLT